MTSRFRPSGALLTYALVSVFALFAVFALPALYVFGREEDQPIDSVYIYDATKQLNETELSNRLARKQSHRLLHLVVFVSDTPLPSPPELTLREHVAANPELEWVDEGTPSRWREGLAALVLSHDFGQLSIVEADDLRNTRGRRLRVVDAINHAHETKHFDEGIERALDAYVSEVDETPWGSYSLRFFTFTLSAAGVGWFVVLFYRRHFATLAFRQAQVCFRRSHVVVDEWKAQYAYAEATGDGTERMKQELHKYMARYDAFRGALNDFGELGFWESFTALASHQAEALWWQGLALIDVERDAQHELYLPEDSGLRMRRRRARMRQMAVRQASRLFVDK